MKGQPKNMAASIRQKLLNLAVKTKEDFGLILTRYALERLLFRLTQSIHRDVFILKGAMLFRVWTNNPYRPTRDLDLLGQGEPSPERSAAVFSEICQVGGLDDGIIFARETVVAERIREDQEYEGVRVTLMSRIENARIPIQVDIGFGDAVVPSPILLDYPTLLDQPAPRLHTYPMPAVVAEKLEAIFQLGMLNSRMKDFFDVWFLASSFPFESDVLATAIRATFERRRTVLSVEEYRRLLLELGSDPKKHLQWKAFISKNRVAEVPEFSAAIQLIDRFMGPSVLAAQTRTMKAERWEPGIGWLG